MLLQGHSKLDAFPKAAQPCLHTEKYINNLLLQKQISFKDGHIVFNRAFQQNFQYLNPLYNESKQQTIRIARKLDQYPNILGEFNYKLEKDFNSKKLMFLDQYLFNSSFDAV